MGTARIKAPIPPAARLNRARNFRRESSAAEGGQPVEELSGFGSFMANFANPSSQRGDEKADTG